MTGTQATLPPRSAVAAEETWDIDSVFPSVSAWEEAFRRASGRLGELDAFHGRLGESAETLLAALRLRDELMREVALLELYAHMRVAVDTTDAEALALLDRSSGLWSQTMAAAAYYEPELLAIEPARLQELLAATPDLAIYRHYVETLERRRPHVRSAEVEQVLAQVQDPLSAFPSIQTALADADLKLGRIQDEQGNEVELGQANYEQFLHSADRSVRQAAWETSSDAYLSMKHVFAANYAGAVKRDVFYARARGYRSSLEAALAPNNIPLEVFHNLIDTVWKNLPVWQRYFQARAKLLGIDRAHAWDISEAPLQPKDAGPQRRITFDEGVEMICAALAPLGEEYVRIAREGFANRWVDRACNAGKMGGAFSSGIQGTYPFILMSWHDTLGSVSTLAHELGHSMHSWYTWQHQPFIYTDYSMFVAEVASNMNQALLGTYLLETERDPDFLITVIEERMGNNLRYLFTMPILARFELECHERVERGEALTADGMIALMADLYTEAYGDAVAIDRERMGITWARFPHLYANFYVFQYATGISAAAELARQVRTEGQPAAERYIRFLSSGSSVDPVDALAQAGVDMRTPAPVQAAFDLLAGYVERLEQLIAR